MANCFWCGAGLSPDPASSQFGVKVEIPPDRIVQVHRCCVTPLNKHLQQKAAKEGKTNV